MNQAASLMHRTLAARAGEAPHPGLVLLHGRGADELDLISLGPELDQRFFVVSVRAPYPWVGMSGYCWYEGERGSGQFAETFQRSLTQLTELVRQLPSAYSIDADRLYLLGFSQGSMMSNALALSSPELLAGAVLLSGFQAPLEYLSVTKGGLQGKPFFVGHGTFDPMLGLDMGHTVRDTLAGLGADVTYREYPMGHQIVGQELVDIRDWLADRLGPDGWPKSILS
jgi:phospholipase/carboxylesterase